MFNKIYKFFYRPTIWISKLPFAGKCSITPAYHRVYSSTGKKKRTQIIVAYSIMAIMLAGHYLQLGLGLDTMARTDSLIIYSVAAIYTFLNAIVLYAQVFLTLRLTGVLFKCLKRKEFSSEGHDPKRVYEYTGKQSALYLAITLAIQFIFIACYFIAL